MSFWSRLGLATRVLRGRPMAQGTSLELLRQLLSSPSKTGQNVTWQTALNVATVLACARVVANGIGQVPLKIMRETAPRKREEARDHPLFALFDVRPNPWQTSSEYRETMALHLALTGQHFSFIARVGVGARQRITELIPLEPQRVTVSRDRDLGLTYSYQSDSGERQDFPPAAIWHVRALSWNSWQGLEVVRLAREAIGLAMAAEETQATLHREGVRPSGLFSIDGVLTDEQYGKLHKWIKTHAMGGVDSGGILVLDNGAKYTPLTMTGVDAQHLETRRMQVEEICRAFGVQPIMVYQADKVATYASAEQSFLQHVVHTLGPWYNRIENSIKANLLTDADRTAGIYPKFNANALLRGDSRARAEFYTKLYMVGALNPNEIRDLEDMNSYDDGDQFRVPANMMVPGDSDAMNDAMDDRGEEEEIP